jgi:two-component system phosphate regulon sensor histidine kinase PhoR
VLHDVTHLRKLERVRQDFVANVSHELKTPLASIQATAETLLDGALEDPGHNVRFVQSIRENADRLHRLVQDLLTLGRIESREDTMVIEPIAVEAVAEACLLRHEQRAQAKDLRLETVPPPQSVTTLADEEALAEILDNLVDNAVSTRRPGARCRCAGSWRAARSYCRSRTQASAFPKRTCRASSSASTEWTRPAAASWAELAWA